MAELLHLYNSRIYFFLIQLFLQFLIIQYYYSKGKINIRMQMLERYGEIIMLPYLIVKSYKTNFVSI